MKSDFETVNFIMSSFLIRRKAKNRVNVIIIMVGVIVVGTVDNVEKPIFLYFSKEKLL